MISSRSFVLRQRPLLKRTLSVVGWGLFVVLLILIWPAKLGGAMSYVIVKGHSMEPTLHPGDFVVLRTGEYDVGDVVSYLPFDDIPAQVIHTIIGFNPEGTAILQGDNNGFVDPFYPEVTDITGKLLFSVPHLGSLVWVLASPLVWGSLVLMAAALYLWPSRTALASQTTLTEAPDKIGSDQTPPAGTGTASSGLGRP